MFQILLLILSVYVLACYAWGGYVAVRLLATGRRRRHIPNRARTSRSTESAARTNDRAAA